MKQEKPEEPRARRAMPMRTIYYALVGLLLFIAVVFRFFRSDERDLSPGAVIVMLGLIGVAAPALLWLERRLGRRDQ